MPDGTADKAKAGVQPRAIHAGMNVVRAKFTAEASSSATDVIQCVKVPNGAIIDEVIFSGVSAGDTGSSPAILNITIGDGDDPNRYASASFTLATDNPLRANLGLGHKYEFSDDAAVQFDTIDVTIGTSANPISASQAFYLTVMYHVDD